VSNDKPSSAIHSLAGPVSELPWSPEFVMQAIEILPVCLQDSTILRFKPDCADSLIVGWPAGAQPEVVAAKAVRGLGLGPLVLHSTSWRHAGGEVVLTYLAVVTSDVVAPESWVIEPVAHVELARGGATTPPPVIGVSQVLEHALRHLSWLVTEDEEIRGHLPDWQQPLKAYVPEPFRALGGPPV
jgi:hypothetical protein